MPVVKICYTRENKCNNYNGNTLVRSIRITCSVGANGDIRTVTEQPDFLLLEDSCFFLQENGDKIILEV